MVVLGLPKGMSDGFGVLAPCPVLGVRFTTHRLLYDLKHFLVLEIILESRLGQPLVC